MAARRVAVGRHMVEAHPTAVRRMAADHLTVVALQVAPQALA